MHTLSKVRKAPVAKTMGIEIECRIPTQQYYDTYHKFIGFFYVGVDGSINDTFGMKGVEFVSQPLTYDWMVREIKKLFTKFPNTSVDMSCGIHVHVSRKWFSDKKAREVMTFLKSIGRIDYDYLFGRSPNDYCDVHTPESEYKIDRYCAINMTNDHTNEFRMFKSGGLEWSLYCAACAKYMVEQAHTINLDAMLAFRDSYPTNF